MEQRNQFERRSVLFREAEQRLLTWASVEGAGLPAGGLADTTILVGRLTRRAKGHIAGEGACGTGRQVTAMPVLDNLDLCQRCTRVFALDGAAGVYYRLAEFLSRATAWVGRLEDVVPGMDWLRYARWTASTPLQERVWVTACLEELQSVGGWREEWQAAQRSWWHLVERAETAWEAGRRQAAPPTRILRAHATDQIADSAEVTSGVDWFARLAGRPDLFWNKKQTPWTAARDAWLDAAPSVADDTVREAMIRAVDSGFGDSLVRDVRHLPTPPFYDGTRFTTPLEWVLTEAAQQRRVIVSGWHGQLVQALATMGEASDLSGERLVLVTDWPIVGQDDREIAYLAQYPLIALMPDAVSQSPRYQGNPGHWSAVLRVPEQAASHALGHRSKTHTVVDGGQAQEGKEVPADLARASLLFLPADTADDPIDAQIPDVAALRDKYREWPGPICDLEFLDAHGADRMAFLAWRTWRWIPQTSTADEHVRTLLVLDAYNNARHTPRTEITVAAGPPDTVREVTLHARITAIDLDARTITYRTDHDHPEATVPLTRIVCVDH